MMRSFIRRWPFAILGLLAVTGAAGVAARALLPRLWPSLQLDQPVVLRLAPDPLVTLLGVSITNTLAGTALSTVCLVAVAVWARFGHSRAARWTAEAIASLVETGYAMIEGLAGLKTARWLFPVVATLFLVIVANAWLAVTPAFGSIATTRPDGVQVSLFRGAGTDINFSLALSLISFFVVQGAGLLVLRSEYVKRFFDVRPFGEATILEGIVALFTGLLHLLTELTRLLSFTFRLFGTLTAGEVLLVVASFLMPLALSVPFYGLELAIGIVQGAVFAGLTTAFVARATSRHEEGGPRG